MRFSIFPAYGALNSAPVFLAFRRGAEKLGHTVVEHDFSADVFVIWSVLWHGRMTKNQEVWKIAKSTGKKILILEIGGLSRGSLWKIGLGHINADGFFGNKTNIDFTRSKKLGIFLKEWKKTGDHILICGQHTKSEQWSTRPQPEVWLKNLVSEVKKHSKRKIVFRPHPRDYVWSQKMENLGISIEVPQQVLGTYDDFNHQDSFSNAWCVINPCSNTAILAAIEGIPVFCDQDSLAYPVSNKDLQKIENPSYPERTMWLEEICHVEWSLEEIEEGTPILRIFD